MCAYLVIQRHFVFLFPPPHYSKKCNHTLYTNTCLSIDVCSKGTSKARLRSGNTRHTEFGRKTGRSSVVMEAVWIQGFSWPILHVTSIFLCGTNFASGRFTHLFLRRFNLEVLSFVLKKCTKLQPPGSPVVSRRLR